MNFVQMRQARFLLMLLVAMVLGIVPGLGRADTYPSRPITLVIPYPPGGTADIIGRLVALELGNQLKQNVVVQNRGGASGNIAAQAVKAAAPDGYTLILGNAPMLAINPHLYKDPGFNPLKDFEPIAPIADVPLFLIAHPSAPYKTLQEFVSWAKQNGAKATYASGSAGSTTNLAMELFMKEAGFRSLHIPYKGSGPALTALVAGEVPVMFELLPSAMGFIKGSRVQALAVTSLERQPTYPDVPTIAESGYPGFQVASWFGVLAPAGTPQPILDKLSTASRSIAALPQLRNRLLELGAAPMTATRPEFARMIKAELGKWETAVRISGAKPE
jgi:tripartite-type tricarboxylate transporter receptor subunit TctC